MEVEITVAVYTAATGTGEPVNPGMEVTSEA